MHRSRIALFSAAGRRYVDYHLDVFHGSWLIDRISTQTLSDLETKQKIMLQALGARLPSSKLINYTLCD
jgi:hypothetical protein